MKLEPASQQLILDRCASRRGIYCYTPVDVIDDSDYGVGGLVRPFYWDAILQEGAVVDVKFLLYHDEETNEITADVKSIEVMEPSIDIEEEMVDNSLLRLRKEDGTRI